MNILISISDLGFGGAQTFVLRLAQALCKKHHVYIYNHELDKQKTELSPFINQISSDIKVIYFPRFPHILHLLAWLAFKIDYLVSSIWKIELRITRFIKNWHFKKIISLYNIDIINSHLFYSDYFVTNVMTDNITPVIITDHGDYRNAVANGFSTWNEINNILKKINALVYPCSYNAQNISQKTNINSIKTVEQIIYNGFFTEKKNNYTESARQKLRISENAFVFGMVARGIPEKGWAEAIQAFELVKKSLVDKEIHLILVGGGDYLPSLKEYWEQKLINTVHFVGYSSEPDYWVESFNVGLLPTYLAGESLPNSIIEYLSLGKPVIATEVGGIPEMISHNGQTTGFIISLNKDGKANVSVMANAMLRYINEYDLLIRHSDLAKQACEKFNMQTCVEAYEELFEKILSQVS